MGLYMISVMCKGTPREPTSKVALERALQLVPFCNVRAWSVALSLSAIGPM